MSGTRSPGRPRAFETAAVLDAAVELFWQQGYRATTTRALERAAGLSQSSLYNAFGSKRQLLVAALDRYETRMNELLGPIETAAEGLASLDTFFADFGAWLIRHRRGCLLVNMMVEDGGQSDDITARTRHYRERIAAAFATALDRARALGEIAGDDDANKHKALLSATMGLCLISRSGATADELQTLVDGVRALVASWRVSS